MKYDDPLEVLKNLTEQKVGFTFEFREEYHDFLEVLIHQVFEPNGYELVAIKQEKEGNPVILNDRTRHECKTLISKYKQAGYKFVESTPSDKLDSTDLWNLKFKKQIKKSQ